MNRRIKTDLLVLLGGLAIATIPLRAADTEAEIKQLKFQIARRVDYLAALTKSDAERTDLDRMVMKRLEESKVSTIALAKGIASAATGLRATEGPEVVGLIKLGRDIKEFGKVQDFIWVVHMVNTSGNIMDERWVSSTTGVVRLMLGGPDGEKPK